jgi:transcriptional regulator with XRE-family HTH domain
MTEDNLQITSSQIRAARALLAWNQQELANRAKVASSTVADFERGKRSPVANNLEAMRAALEGGGVTFLPGGAVTGPPPEAQHSTLTPAGKPIRLIEATDLSQWAERLDSKAVFPQLIHRLILAATSNSFTRLRFPAAESIQQESWDGVCEQYAAKELPWLPLGSSGWELSTQRSRISSKAEEDYKKRTHGSHELIREKSTFVFASLKRWPKGQAWAQSKIHDAIWADVRVVDADDLVHWIELYPSVGYWLASHLGKLPPGFLPLSDNWHEWRLATNWPLTPEIVIAGRDNEAIDLLKWLRGMPSVRSVQADSPDEAMAFLYGAIDLLPEPHRSFYIMRSLRAYMPEAARTLGSSPSPLIVVMEPSEPGLAVRLAEQGHHVFVAYGSAVGISDMSTVLPRSSHEAFQSALEVMGVPEAESLSLTRDSVRSLAVLRRLIPAASIKNPDWAEEQKARSLIPALLAGGWDASREADRLVLEQLSGEKFESFESQCISLTGFPDAPLRHAGSAWKIASPRDAWFRLARLIGRSDLERFATIAQSVLGAADPRFEVSPDERWLAGIRGQLPKYSPWLSAGLTETLLLLAMFSDHVKTVSDAGQYSSQIVAGLLLGADAQRWYSLSHQLRTLAEAAPDTFLGAVEKSLGSNDTPIMTLFQEDGGPLMGGANHSDLLWALETLAWSPQYLSRVAEILARLSALDPGGKWGNRPKNSLRTIFLLWKPQTNATLEERLRVLDHLREVEQDEAWKVMLSILPAGYDTTSPTPQPRWRDFSVAKPEDVTYALIADGAVALSKRLVEDACTDPHRWVQLIEALPNLAPEWRKNIFTKLTELAGVTADDSSRMPVSAALRKLLSHHRSFPDAQWAMQEGELKEIEHVYHKFEPVDEINQRIWLFSHSAQLVSGQRGEDWNARDEELAAKRRVAITEIISACGLPSLRRLIKEAEKPHLVGFAYGQQIDNSSEANGVLEDLLGEDEPSTREFVHGLIAVLHNRFGSMWSKEFLKNARKRDWDRARIVRLLLALPSEKETWELADSFGDEIRSEYWESASTLWPRDDEGQTVYGIHHLLSARRARAAVHLIAGSRQRLSADLVIRMLRQAAEEPWPNSHDSNESVMFQWSVCQLLRRLDEDTDVPEAQIAHLEWMYLALLEHSERPPVILHRFISRDPAFFVQALSAIYRAHSESPTDKEKVPNEVKALASQAFRLMQTWNIVPGTNAGGTDAAALAAWVKEAHRLAVLAERGAVGDAYIGRVLSFAKADPDGIWPESAVRNVIDQMKNDHIESGFLSGVHNNRGVTRRALLDGGAQERGLASDYRSWADALKFEWPRTASLLERIACSFEETARFHDEHAEFTDWTY